MGNNQIIKVDVEVFEDITGSIKESADGYSLDNIPNMDQLNGTCAGTKLNSLFHDLVECTKNYGAHTSENLPVALNKLKESLILVDEESKNTLNVQ
ncbi:hypothetical protein [Butyrivibrio proteoclasticus]|uniref:hypothetical protein n=1 Tax=Butyrivibrio proteoclasticus TaxID=43305 RepID=UPI00047ED568|nr:hypothetical protein [Butyrivibrio proteoclasticus]